MSVKAILFDLDATLLPMDQARFIREYFGRLTAKLAALGYDGELFSRALMSGVGAMVKNDGRDTNEQVFWQIFRAIFGDDFDSYYCHFEDFYEHDFDAIREVVGYTPESRKIVDALSALGLRLILATNPVFPAVATEKRIGWAGLSTSDFELYTTYENSSYCKPNPAYFTEIIEKCGLSADECIMVGNDTSDDMSARLVGMDVFLLTDCLINKENKDISEYPHGSFGELSAYIKSKVS